MGYLNPKHEVFLSQFHLKIKGYPLLSDNNRPRNKMSLTYYEKIRKLLLDHLTYTQ